MQAVTTYFYYVNRRPLRRFWFQKKGCICYRVLYLHILYELSPKSFWNSIILKDISFFQYCPLIFVSVALFYSVCFIFNFSWDFLSILYFWHMNGGCGSFIPKLVIGSVNIVCQSLNYLLFKIIYSKHYSESAHFTF